MDEVDNLAATGRTGEKYVRRDHKRAVARYGVEHVHDISCRTWRGMNWVGACDCFLAEHQAILPKYRVSVYGLCAVSAPHQTHVIPFGKTQDPDGTVIAQKCPGIHKEN